jgi:hypothetical protein
MCYVAVPKSSQARMFLRKTKSLEKHKLVRMRPECKLGFEGTTAGVRNDKGLEYTKYFSEDTKGRKISVELRVYGRKIRLILHKRSVNTWNGLNWISQHPPSPSRLISIGADAADSFSCVHKLKTAVGKKFMFPDYALNVI